MTRFALVGAAGFVAPRHMKAIADVGGMLLAAADPCDSVGVLDHHFPEALFFPELERFDRYLEKLRREGRGVDYISICSPNYLHDAHVRLALRLQADAICEKPLVISPWNLDALAALEEETQRRVFAVLQLRHLSGVRALKSQFEQHAGSRASVQLDYVTPRGPWYFSSWKGDHARSGGLAMNIGIHFFDLLCWVFGEVEKIELLESSPQVMSGHLVLRKADVTWRLSVRRSDLPQSALEGAPAAYRSLRVDGQELDLSESATKLHTAVYRAILSGNGYGVEESRPAVELAHRLGGLSLSLSR